MSPPNDTVEIRALRDDEVTALNALSAEIWRAHYPGIISVAQIESMLAERYNEAVIREELRRRDIWWDVLLLNGQMTGYTSYFITSVPGTVKIDKLYLHPRAHRKGYGGLLMDHVARRMAAQGCQRLMLAVNRRNRTAIAAYRKHGFVITNTSLKKIAGGFWMDDYIMVREAGRAA
jgi:ribosomal protein S18 acetylase RimI-like enzyme